MSHEWHGISNHLQLNCWFSSLFRLTTKTIKTLYYWHFVSWGNPQVTSEFPSQMANNTKIFSMLWCYLVTKILFWYIFLPQSQFAPVKGDFSTDFKNLIQDMLQREPEYRPSAAELWHGRLPDVREVHTKHPHYHLIQLDPFSVTILPSQLKFNGNFSLFSSKF